MAPRSLEIVRMGATTHIIKTNHVVDGLVRVALRFDVALCRITVTDDCIASFDPVRKNRHQGFGGSVWNGN